jgi:methylenetetrahydrofolate dehydrogenase (NADP+)/methenyltetrahydrofolate cyclohydrolase
MKVIEGKKIADKILADLKKQIKARKIKPCLAIILIGDNPASHLYVRLKEKAAREIGVKIKKYLLPKRVSEKEVLRIIESLNQDSRVNGILVQMPLPSKVSADRIIPAIDPKKDVDGFLPQSKFNPPLILAIWQALKATKENLKNKETVAMVNSDVFGQALGYFFKKKRVKFSYTLAGSKGMRKRIKEADILITVLGRPNFIKGSLLKKEVILIDGGITKRGKRVIGDIDRKSVAKKASWLTPVPGGIGPITVALLLKNVVLATKR